LSTQHNVLIILCLVVFVVPKDPKGFRN